MSIFWEIPSIMRCNSLNRLGSCLRAKTTRIVHFPETTSNPCCVPSIALKWPAILSPSVCRCLSSKIYLKVSIALFCLYFIKEQYSAIVPSSSPKTRTHTSGGGTDAPSKDCLPIGDYHVGFLLARTTLARSRIRGLGRRAG